MTPCSSLHQQAICQTCFAPLVPAHLDQAGGEPRGGGGGGGRGAAGDHLGDGVEAVRVLHPGHTRPQHVLAELHLHSLVSRV